MKAARRILLIKLQTTFVVALAVTLVAKAVWWIYNWNAWFGLFLGLWAVFAAWDMTRKE